ncbi:YoaK family protein [Streptomyces poriticola]|uniref:YoaK family protein n=1 Tax=Streptomyces poriticola TaxID=3120506 RepID=UPI002FCE3A0C
MRGRVGRKESDKEGTALAGGGVEGGAVADSPSERIRNSSDVTRLPGRAGGFWFHAYAIIGIGTVPDTARTPVLSLHRGTTHGPLVQPLPRSTRMGEDATVPVTLSTLVIVANGYVDAYLYMAHGGVFAGAQTGNLVLFCVDLAQPRSHGSLAHLWPMTAFVAGVVVAGLFRGASAEGRRAARCPLLYALALETAVLTVIGLAPGGIPQTAITTSVGFVVALQVVFFQAVRPAAFLTVAMTGNLTRVTGAVLTAHRTRSRSDLRLAALYASVIVSFGAGAAIGALGTAAMGTRSSLVAAGLFAVSWAWLRVLVPGRTRSSAGTGT